jgi:hypothetical protein
MGEYIRYIPNDDLENRLSYKCTFVLSSNGRITFVVGSPVRRFKCEKEGISAGGGERENTVFLCIITSNSNTEWISYPKTRGATLLASNLDTRRQLHHQKRLLETTVTTFEETRKLYFKKHRYFLYLCKAGN